MSKSIAGVFSMAEKGFGRVGKIVGRALPNIHPTDAFDLTKQGERHPEILFAIDRNDRYSIDGKDFQSIIDHTAKKIAENGRIILMIEETETISAGNPYMVLTNNSRHTPRDLAAHLRRLGLDVTDADIWTSALATARFLR